MSSVIITITTHKSKPNQLELISFKQALKVLNRRKFSLVVPENLNVDFYIKLFKSHNIDFQIDFFENKYFGTIANYSRLVLSKDFYGRFSKFEYLLIYHLDAFVFRDELDFWCRQGYDYYAPPWFKGFDNKSKTKELWFVGCGGFCLRKVEACLRILNEDKIQIPFFSLYNYYTKNDNSTIKLLKIPYIFLMSLGYKNNKAHYLNNFPGEDVFWCYFTTKIKNPLNVLPLSDSVSFGFDGNPEILFNYTKQKLPFGCHAWFKYDVKNLKFWSKHIENEGHIIPKESV